jgi:hypothetical protein
MGIAFKNYRFGNEFKKLFKKFKLRIQLDEIKIIQKVI